MCRLFVNIKQKGNNKTKNRWNNTVNQAKGKLKVKNGKKRIWSAVIGVFAGVLNGLFGAGGGVVLVPCLKLLGIETKKSHATSVAVIFVLSIVSCVMYLKSGNIDWALALKYIPVGLLGAVCGGMLLNKIKGVWLTRIFGILIIISGVRSIMS